MYYEKQKGEAKEKFRLKQGVSAPHERIVDGKRVTIEPGDVFHPTARELDAFGDKFEVVVERQTATFDDDADLSDPVDAEVAKKKAEAEAAKKKAEAEAAKREAEAEEAKRKAKAEQAKKNTEDENLPHNEDEFASPEAFKLWVANEAPEMTVPKTGHNGSTWAKADVEKQLEEMEEE